MTTGCGATHCHKCGRIYKLKFATGGVAMLSGKRAELRKTDVIGEAPTKFVNWVKRAYSKLSEHGQNAKEIVDVPPPTPSRFKSLVKVN